MRKLRPAEERVLRVVPEDIPLGERTFAGVLYPHQWPKNTPYTTIINLYDMGLIEHAFNVYHCPFKLSDKGKKLLKSRR